MYLDITLDPGASLIQKVPSGWNAFVYTLAGELTTTSPKSRYYTSHDNGSSTEGETITVKPHYTVMYEADGEVINMTNKETNKEKAHLVLIAGEPLKEPIVQHGPFVMNTEEEIREAIADYRYERNGFENAHRWKSKSGARLLG